jgi:hypothetical protein
MTNRHRASAGTLVGTCVVLLLSAVGMAQTMTTHARGTFDVTLKPQATDQGGDAALARMTIDKQYHGELAGTGKGQMLAMTTEVKDSGVYVAIERFTGTLGGHTGTFVLAHTGIMNRGQPQLTITVVPDSGTGELAGLSGKMAIIIADGKHSYEFDYTLEKAPYPQ